MAAGEYVYAEGHVFSGREGKRSYRDETGARHYGAQEANCVQNGRVIAHERGSFRSRLSSSSLLIMSPFFYRMSTRVTNNKSFYVR